MVRTKVGEGGPRHIREEMLSLKGARGRGGLALGGEATGEEGYIGSQQQAVSC